MNQTVNATNESSVQVKRALLTDHVEGEQAEIFSAVVCAATVVSLSSAGEASNVAKFDLTLHMSESGDEYGTAANAL